MTRKTDVWLCDRFRGLIGSTVMSDFCITHASRCLAAEARAGSAQTIQALEDATLKEIATLK